MKKIFQYLSFLLLISLFFSTCRKDECDDPTNRICPNYDPCLSVSKADASFVVLDSITPGWADTTIGFVSDTFDTGSTIYFKALNEDMASYEWKVGTDTTTFTGREFNLGFAFFEGAVTVRLITMVENYHSCLSETEMRDTFYESFDVISYDSPHYGVIYGAYRGTNTEHPNQEYTLTVVKEGEDLWHSHRLFGLQIPCDYPIGLKFQGGHDWFVSNHDELHCRNTIVIGRMLEDNNTLHVDYWYDDDEGKRLHHVFEGVRL